MSRTVIEPALAPAPAPAAAPLVAAGLPLALSAIPGIAVFGNSAAFSEVAGTPAHLLCYGLSLVGLLALLVAVPRLGTMRPGRALPGPLLAAAVVATALNAGSVYVQLFVVPQLAVDNPAYLDEQAGGILMVGMIGSWILYLLAWVSLGVVALRRRALPVPAGALLITGAVLQPLFGPLAALPFGAGLLLAARAARRGRNEAVR